MITDYAVTQEIIDYATDMKERPRIEYIEMLNAWLIVFQVISKSDHINKITLPVTIILSSENIILFTTYKTMYIEQYFNNLKKNQYCASNWEVYFRIMGKISKKFIDKIETVSNKRTSIQRSLVAKRVTDKEILQLSIIQEEISYLITAVNSNFRLLRENKFIIKKNNIQETIEASAFEELDDAIIEFEQVQKMIELLSDITDKLATSFNNLLNNQTNATMKVLTIYSLVLSIPTIISGFFGMNMVLPVANKPWSWLLSLGLVLIGSGIIFLDLKRRHFT